MMFTQAELMKRAPALVSALPVEQLPQKWLLS